QELTTEGGLDVVSQTDRLIEVISELHAHNIVVSLFINPTIHQIKAASRTGADYVELHTGEYANASDIDKMAERLDEIASMAIAASKLGLGVSAGHGLDYQNVPAIARIERIEELNIGHSIISRAVLVGLDRAVREMKELTNQ
ncbi:MAG TPA: pyridoxine 5'-phosphate synthase, partial [Bacteroidetes bacterium]|nr:pyridoxine 5'-phosphate synthase [Bacteroidota bacterium]